jgi:DNA-binding PadR family transcriptional regulator
MRPDADEIGRLLPLQPATFHILVALADEDRHGYAIMQDVAARTNGAIRLSPGTLYRSIQRMLDEGLIVAAVARAEAGRLAELVRLARARGLAPRKI